MGMDWGLVILDGEDVIFGGIGEREDVRERRR